MEKNSEFELKKGMSPLTAGFTGLILGIAGTAMIALSDKETRKKASKKAHQIRKDVQKWSEQTVDDFQTKRQELKDDSEDQLNEKKGETETLTQEGGENMRTQARN